MHESIKHSVREFVRGQVHSNGIESFWSMPKRGYIGIYHYMSVKHLHRYVCEFVARHNLCPLDTENQMSQMVKNAEGKRLLYRDLVAPKLISLPLLMRDSYTL